MSFVIALQTALDCGFRLTLLNLKLHQVYVLVINKQLRGRKSNFG